MMTDEAPRTLDMAPPDPKEYWVLYAHTTDWAVLLQRLVLTMDPTKGAKPLDPKIAVIGMKQGEYIPIYYLSREFFPIEKIAALIGKPVEALSGIETLHLREFKGEDGKPAQAGWQAPSVDYWGMA